MTPVRAAVALAAAALVAAPAGATPAASPCLNLQARRLEVCTAYVVNATLGARVPYYKFARSTNPARARAARYRLESRFIGTARQKLERQVATWPRVQIDVDVPRLDVESVAVDRAETTAVVVTRETWLVKTEAGRTLFSESDRRHVIRMRRLEGLVLHKWVVERL